MSNPVIAIGLDAADPNLLERWMAAGKLKNLSQLRAQGAYGQLHNRVNYNHTPVETSSTERLWVMFNTGCQPDKTGFWSPIHYSADSYGITHDTINGAYDFQQYPPFYALGKEYKVVAFDVPVSRLSDNVNGLQILGWGGHAPHTPSHSSPTTLLPELIEQYGKNPILHQDYGCWWNDEYLKRIQTGLKISTDKRAEICQELLSRDNWDLFLTVFGESHTASHDFWHLSQSDHPLYAEKCDRTHDPMLEVFQDIDRAVGKIISAAPDNANILVFAVHGMDNNVTDMHSMVFLPEVLYRYSFSGSHGLAKGNPQTPCPPMVVSPKRKSWSGEVWQRRYDQNPVKRALMPWIPSQFDHRLQAGPQPALESPYHLRQQGVALNWMPAMWYSQLWPRMKAFALPAFAAGHIRINLKEREDQGIIPLDEYETTCDQLIQILHQLKDGRTGQPIVKTVVRTRTLANALSCEPTLPDADLVVIWADHPSDVVDSPDIGRIGPITYYRSGGHRADGFLLAKGPNITRGSNIQHAQAIDIGPTIRELMGAPPLRDCDGKSLFSNATNRLDEKSTAADLWDKAGCSP